MNHLAGTYVPDRCSHVLASLAILVNPGPDMQISVCVPLYESHVWTALSDLDAMSSRLLWWGIPNMMAHNPTNKLLHAEKNVNKM